MSMPPPELILPIAQGLLCAGAGAAYLWQGDLRLSAYWLCAAGITAAVTWPDIERWLL